MKKIKLMILLLCAALVLFGCGAEKEDSSEAGNPAADIQETEQPTQICTEPVYEEVNMYLCTLETMTQYESGFVSRKAYAYDEFGRILESWPVMDGGSKGAVTFYTYDNFGNNIGQRTDTGCYEMTYDEAGHLLSKLYYSDDTCKSEYHYVYDDQGRVTEETRISRYSEETKTLYSVRYSEDGSSAEIEKLDNGEKTGYTLETYNPAGLVLRSDNYDSDGDWKSGSTYEYDDQNRLILESRYSRSETQADYDIIYTYDENGLLVSKDVDYYYGYLLEYTYEPVTVLVQAG